ncbi:hypothetical protein GCM10010376_96470 [Streptomyces violaceusniger]
MRICPCCGELQDNAYEPVLELAVLSEQCPKCGYHFPVLGEQPSSVAVFKDVLLTALEETPGESADRAWRVGEGTDVHAEDHSRYRYKPDRRTPLFRSCRTRTSSSFTHGWHDQAISVG